MIDNIIWWNVKDYMTSIRIIAGMLTNVYWCILEYTQCNPYIVSMVYEEWSHNWIGGIFCKTICCSVKKDSLDLWSVERFFSRKASIFPYAMD